MKVIVTLGMGAVFELDLDVANSVVKTLTGKRVGYAGTGIYERKKDEMEIELKNHTIKEETPNDGTEI